MYIVARETKIYIPTRMFSTGCESLCANISWWAIAARPSVRGEKTSIFEASNASDGILALIFGQPRVRVRMREKHPGLVRHRIDYFNVSVCLTATNPPAANALASPHDTSAENESKTRQSSKQNKPSGCRNIVVCINNTQTDSIHARHLV